MHFGAKHTLFSGPFGAVLEAFGAIPLVRAQDDRRPMERNLEAFERFTALLGEGRVTAIFPEGLTQDEPHLSPVKTGAARIALQAEDAAGFTLKLTVVPVGLQFEPRRRFRADAFVRFGEPFTISDLAPRHAEASRRAVQELTDRIDAALKRVAYHIESTEQIPLVNGSPTSMLGARAEPVSLGYGAGGFVANCCKESLRASTTMPGPTRKPSNMSNAHWHTTNVFAKEPASTAGSSKNLHVCCLARWLPCRQPPRRSSALSPPCSVC